MRYYRFRIQYPDAFLHPIERDVVPESDFNREQVVHIELLNDETGVAVYRAEGDADAVEERIADHEMVLDHEVFGVEDGRFHLYVHFEPGYPATRLMRIADSHGLVLDTPFVFDDNGLEITVLGREASVQDALPDFMRVTEEINIVLEQVGDYHPDRGRTDELTDRQREVLAAAVEEGYYEAPRGATQEDVARSVGTSASTVGEHLQKIEAKVMNRAHK